MTQTAVENQDAISKLDLLEYLITDGIPYAVITETEDLWHEEDETVVRAFTFNNGMREQIVVLGPDAYIYANYVMTEHSVSERLIRDLIPILFDFMTFNLATDSNE